ncbi:hypothetical protein B0H65DRAFT_469653 [Neurospora tetraspora]|uniref:Uncharacterized protein n=1 Tax=Neurospora tetraspora TaxID=94610 RepID=A0AAE0JCX9_9PEZI|nr:hypothetical protein B0H65DRAFT_469653 [Neurospora tetraspora]
MEKASGHCLQWLALRGGWTQPEPRAMDCREARCIIQNKRKSWGFWKPSRNLPQEDKFQSLANLRYHNSAPHCPCPEIHGL